MELNGNLIIFSNEEYLKCEAVITLMCEDKLIAVVDGTESTMVVRTHWWGAENFLNWLSPKDIELRAHLANFGVIYKEDLNAYVVRLLNVQDFHPYFEMLKNITSKYWYVYEPDGTFHIIFMYDNNARDFSLSAIEYNMKRYVETSTKKPTPYASVYAAGKLNLAELVDTKRLIPRDATYADLAELVANEEIHTNEKGGKQSYTPACFDLLPPEAIATVAIVLGHGAAKYGANNWRNIDVADHVNHALQHLFSYLSCPNEEDLSHAATRLLFALELYKVASNCQAESTYQPNNNNATTLQ